MEYEDLKSLVVKDKQLIDCRYLHRDSCFWYCLKNSFSSTMNLKKALLLLYIVRLI